MIYKLTIDIERICVGDFCTGEHEERCARILAFGLESSYDFTSFLTYNVEKAYRRIIIATYVFGLSKHRGIELARALGSASRRGVDVEVVLNGYSDFSLRHNCRALYALYRLGVRDVIFTSKRMHAKVYVVDDLAWIGSSNIGFQESVEVMVELSGRAVADAVDYVRRISMAYSADPWAVCGRRNPIE